MEEYKDNFDLPAKAPGTALKGQGNTSPAVDRISDLMCRELINRAIKAQKLSYAPYSHWNVGAALLAKNGNIITGSALGAAIPFALEIIAYLEGPDIAEKKRRSIVYRH